MKTRLGGVEVDVTQPTYFLSHGGGPWPWIKDQLPGDLDRLEASLIALPGELPAPPASILIISAHWVTDTFTVQRNPRPPMLYDYGGFPEFTYQLQYPASGSVALADTVHDLLQGAGLRCAVDEHRGFDHGVFAPLAVTFPQADVPIVQLSIRSTLDPAEHLAVGRLLAPLRDQNVLILGSGLSFHNLRAFGPSGTDASVAFDNWLTETLTAVSSSERARRLTLWADAPSARVAHPLEDHLIPLMVAVGAAGDDPGTRTYHQDDFMGSVSASSYRFGRVDAAH